MVIDDNRYVILKLVTTLIFLFASQAHSQETVQQSATCGPPSSSVKYDWERYDYYQVLGLPPSDQEADQEQDASTSRKQRREIREAIDSQQIRRAYRKQAQQHHPDKMSNNKNSNATTTVTVEESTTRFARISEAYEVLNNADNRHDYDLWLLDCEDRHMGQSQSTRRSESRGDSWSVFDSFSDPRRVFEEFFSNSERDDLWNRRQHQNQQPVRVEETQKVLIDPYSGQEILRVYRTEEFASNKSGKYQYRVTAQDFVEQYDRLYGWEYQPISSPVVVEEGYREEADFRDERERADALSSNEFITLHSQPLVSANGRFYAGLSPECDLIVVSGTPDSANVEDSVIWSSGTFVPRSAGECFLSLQGPYLVLALGTPENPGQILWNTDVPDSIFLDDNDGTSGGPAPIYLVRLDDDGSLVVYSQKRVPHTPDNKERTDLYSNPSSKTRAAQAWRSVKRWAKNRLFKKADDHFQNTSDSQQAFITQEVCVFATGPAGCNFPGRKLLQLAHGVRATMKRALTKIDTTVDSLVELILDDQDEDLIDTFARIVGTAGSNVAKAGSALARKGVKIIQKRLG